MEGKVVGTVYEVTCTREEGTLCLVESVHAGSLKCEPHHFLHLSPPITPKRSPNMALELAHENIWFDKWRVDDAEREFYEKKAQGSSGLGSLASQIAKARQEIQNSLVSGGRTASGSSGGGGGVNADLLNRITKLEGENTNLTKTVSTLEQTIMNLTTRLEKLEFGSRTTTNTTATPKKSEAMETEEEEEDDDDDVDLFGSDEEDEEAERIKEERLKAYAEKKAKKPGPIAKSSVLLDCKPWDDETDMSAMEVEIRKIQMDGLVWGASKLVPLAYGIQKLSILCTVEDEKVSIDDLSEKIQEIEDYVQSVDIGAFNKI